MKVFSWNKEKVVQVRIVNDTPRCTRTAAATSLPIKAETKPLNYELGLKLAALIALVLNSLLAIIGYVDFTGKLETLGISTNEIDLGLPTLLFQGYLAIVLDGYTYIASHFPWGILGLSFIPSLFLYFPVSKLLKSRSRIDSWVFCLLLTLGLVIISIIPTIGLKRGIDSAFSTFEKENPIDRDNTIKGLRTETTIQTKEGPTITGDTVFASTLYTYVLQRSELYKIANRDNHIVSITVIHPEMRSAPKVRVAPPATPASPSAQLKQSAQTSDTPATQSIPGTHHRWCQ
jgi:hypothetical protein